jgi:acetolactate synthase-1/3 small subunit
LLQNKVPVWAVLDYTNTKLIERELLLIKVSILGPEHLHEQLPTTKLDKDVEYVDEKLNAVEEVGYRKLYYIYIYSPLVTDF